MTVLLISPPAVEPVSLDEAKAHLRLTGTDDDTWLAAMIAAARIHVETATRRSLIDQTWRLCLDAWPPGDLLVLPVGPVRAVTEITVYDAEGTPSLLPPSAWTLDVADARLHLGNGGPRPGRVFNGLEIDMIAGYGPSSLSVPQPLRLAVMMLVARWYEDREGMAFGLVAADIAGAFETLIAPYCRKRLR